MINDNKGHHVRCFEYYKQLISLKKLQMSFKASQRKMCIIFKFSAEWTILKYSFNVFNKSVRYFDVILLYKKDSLLRMISIFVYHSQCEKMSTNTNNGHKKRKFEQIFFLFCPFSRHTLCLHMQTLITKKIPGWS